MANGRSTYGFDFNPSELELQKTIIDGVSSYRIASFKQYEKIVEALIKQSGSTEIAAAENVYKEKLRRERELRREIDALGEAATREQLEDLRQAVQARILAEEQYQEERIKLDAQAAKISDRFERERYKKLNVFQRAEYQKTVAERAKSTKKELEQEQIQVRAQQAALKEARKTATDPVQIADIEASLAKFDTRAKQIRSEIKSAQKHGDAADAQYKILYEVTATHEQKAQDHRAKADEKEKEKLGVAAEALLKISEIESDTTETTQAERDAKIKQVRDEAQKKQKELERQAAEERKLAAQEEQAAKNEANWSPEGLEKTLKDNLNKMADKLGSAINTGLNQITENVNTFYEYQAKVEARLQGSEASYKDSLEKVRKNVAFSGYVRQKDVINNLVKLVDSGVAYNVDLRAFLATISEDIASTFDAFDSNLLKMIRIQQADTTAARLGMEASLTRLFNEFFSDTSYLSDAFDGVTQALSGVSALKTKDDSLEFEYMVQKWLGSLYSLGLSDSAANTIAQGLGYLGTGDVEALNGNDSLQTLLAMSASQGGLSYADLLSGGLTADNTNKLLKSMIEYLKEISANTDSSVVTKSAYANLFGLTTTDLRSIQNISTDDITKLYNTSMNYGDMMSELSYQTGQIASRTHISQVLENVFDNALMSTSTTLGNSSGIWGTWMTLNLIEDLTGGINIPAISVMGNAVDLQTTVTALAKGGIAGLGLMGSLISALASGNLGANYDVNAWGFDEYTSRGGDYTGIVKGVNTGFSSSQQLAGYTGSASSDDMKSNSLSQGTESAQDDAKVTNASVEEEGDIYTKIYNALADDSSSVISRINELHNNVVVNGNALKVQLDFSEAGVLDVNLQSMSELIKNYLSKLTVESSASMFGVTPDSEESPSLITVMREALNGMDVNVANDNFQTVVDRISMTGL